MRFVAEYMDPGLLPKDYKPVLSRKDAALAADAVKQFIEDRLRRDLNLFKHTSPLAFVHGTGVNDDLDGSEAHKAVLFHVANIPRDRGVVPDGPTEAEKYGFDAEVVSSLAKWKRLMLRRYGCEPGSGLFCESTSIRKGYKGDVTHSNICDQWDWEVAITPEQRTLDTLKATVRTLYRMIKDCEAMVAQRWPGLRPTLPDDIHFVTAEELHAEWPEADIHGREDAAVRRWGAIFIVGMGWPMQDGSAPEEVRAPDYDDWTLNGDIIVKHPATGYRHELSSMGIRVDRAAMEAQLAHRGQSERSSLAYHKAVIDGALPLCMGGGIGISRLLMLLLQRGHVGEVQVGIWHDAHHAQAKAAGLDLIPDRIIGAVEDM